MSRVVLSGYYGFNNAGDELVLYAMVRTLREIRPDLEITVLSQQPEKTAKQYDVQAVNRWSVFGILKAVAGCDLLISGGGSLFQDITSSNSPLYYWSVLFLAKLLGKKTMAYSQGVGPFKKKNNRRLASWLFHRLDIVTVRDEGSKTELISLGVKREIIVTADPVLGFPEQAVRPEAGRALLERSGVVFNAEKRLLGVFVRSWQEDKFLPALVKACDTLSAAGWQIVFVPMHFPQDITIAKQAAKQMTANSVCIKEMGSPEEMLSLTKNFDLLIGMRLHALINGAVAGVPLVGISYDPKVERFLQQIGQQSLNTVEELNAETLVALVKWVDENRAEIAKDMTVRMGRLRQKAWQAARLAVGLLEMQ
ncbi:MAG: polysaccharide pyruvyl transferase CsaB [Clostridia bacterium]|nr:polysaccharide pyruvyl transferase CsaB [Clostridia bacterium]